MAHPQRRKRSRRVAMAAAAVVLVVVGGALYYRLRTGDVSRAHARFLPETTPAPAAVRAGRPFIWPLYGYTPNHTRFFAAPATLHAPFTQVWERGGGAVLEFPPVLHGNRLVYMGDDGVLTAINKNTGHTFWARSLGTLSASSPAVSDSTVYATVLRRAGGGGGGGGVAAVDLYNGSLRWARDLPSPSESSPLLDGARIYLGSQNGTVYALSADDGVVAWTYHAPGAVKASPSLKNGTLYFGDYSGRVQAISEATGRRRWISGSGGAVFGSGQFYSTAAVVYGRVFLGNTDGRIYSYDAGSGQLDWAHQTGDYVYSSPAVTNAPGLGPTIYMGSYDGNFYALDARTGSVRWLYRAGGRISGSATIVGRTVYFADLGERNTIGLGISTGRTQFRWPSGSFDPVISDGARIYLTGYTGLYALLPIPTGPAVARRPPSPAARPRQAARRPASPAPRSRRPPRRR